MIDEIKICSKCGATFSGLPPQWRPRCDHHPTAMPCARKLPRKLGAAAGSTGATDRGQASAESGSWSIRAHAIWSQDTGGSSATPGS